jgi:hypothetical protein
MDSPKLQRDRNASRRAKLHLQSSWPKPGLGRRRNQLAKKNPLLSRNRIYEQPMTNLPVQPVTEEHLKKNAPHLEAALQSLHARMDADESRRRRIPGTHNHPDVDQLHPATIGSRFLSSLCHYPQSRVFERQPSSVRWADNLHS